MFWNKKIKIGESNLDSTMIELGREIERCHVLWYALVTNHWEDMKGNLYHQAVDLMMRDILKNAALTDADRMKKANELLVFSRSLRNQVNKTASNYKKFIDTRLSQFEEMLEKPESLKIDKIPESLSQIKLHNKNREYVSLSRDLCNVREKEILAINAHMDTDEFIPNIFIRDEGKPDHQMTEEENKFFAEKLATCYALRDLAQQEERKIEPNRSNITK